MSELTASDRDSLRRMTAEINRRIAPIFAEMERDRREVEATAARRDPEGHARSHLMGGDGSARYRWCDGGTNGRGQRVRFCYSVNPNVAGRFLVWREIVSKRKTACDQFSYVRSKKSATGLSRRHAAESRKK